MPSTSRVIFYGFIVIMGIMALVELAKPARAEELSQTATNNVSTLDWGFLISFVAFVLLLIWWFRNNKWSIAFGQLIQIQLEAPEDYSQTIEEAKEKAAKTATEWPYREFEEVRAQIGLLPDLLKTTMMDRCDEIAGAVTEAVKGRYDLLEELADDTREGDVEDYEDYYIENFDDISSVLEKQHQLFLILKEDTERLTNKVTT